MTDTKMTKKTPEQIEEMANTSGFILEFKAKGIFDDNNYLTRVNDLIVNGTYRKEVDLYAQKGNCHFLVECKGAEKGSNLILIKEQAPQSHTSNPHAINFNNWAICEYNARANLNRCYTGDFYKSNDKKYAKNDIENNLYKAKEQLTELIIAQYCETKNNGNYSAP